MIKKFLITLIARLYTSTFRFNVVNRDVAKKLVSEKKRVVFPLWHNQLFCFLGESRHFNLVSMISRSKDGDYFASLIESLGITVVRASSSRGASAGTLELLEFMDKGYCAVMAADGPKGPKYQIKSGSLYLAKKADGIIIPVLADCKRFYRFNSWDNFILPKLFSKIDITFCDPIYVNTSLEKEDMDRELESIQNKIMELTRVYSKNII